MPTSHTMVYTGQDGRAVQTVSLTHFINHHEEGCKRNICSCSKSCKNSLEKIGKSVSYFKAILNYNEGKHMSILMQIFLF
jgi:hypothetical protein